MARNLLFTMTTGSTGKVLWFRFEPTNIQTGVPEALDLTGATVTMTVTKGSTTHLDAVSCTPSVDQVADKGEGTFTFSAPQALLAPGQYNLRFHAVKSGQDYYFPDLPNREYAVLKVNRQ